MTAFRETLSKPGIGPARPDIDRAAAIDPRPPERHRIHMLAVNVAAVAIIDDVP